MTKPVPDDAPLRLFADQLGPAVYGGEHAHREVVLIEATSAPRRLPTTARSRIWCSALRHAHRDLGERAHPAAGRHLYRRAAPLQAPVLVHQPTSHAAGGVRAPPSGPGLIVDVLPTPTFALPALTSPSGRAAASASGWRTSTASSAAASGS